jgi:hypothetical protein
MPLAEWLQKDYKAFHPQYRPVSTVNQVITISGIHIQRLATDPSGLLECNKSSDAAPTAAILQPSLLMLLRFIVNVHWRRMEYGGENSGGSGMCIRVGCIIKRKGSSATAPNQARASVYLRSFRSSNLQGTPQSAKPFEGHRPKIK